MLLNLAVKHYYSSLVCNIYIQIHLFANELAEKIQFQVITCGTNRMIAYWEIYDGSLIREVEGSKSSALNTLDITANGKYFATGGSDQVVKVI